MRNHLPIVVWVATGLVWGTTWGLIRIGLRDLPPFTFAAARTVLAALVLWGLIVARRPRTGGTGAGWMFWATVGVLQVGVPYALIFWAEQSISSGLTAVLFATFPAFTTVIAHFLLVHEPLTRGKVGGTTLALGAVFLLANPFDGGGTDLAAVVAVVLASLTGATGAVLVRRHGRERSTLWITAVQITAAAGFLVLLAATAERGQAVRWTPAAVASTVYLAVVVTVGCYLGLFWLLQRMDATFVSMGVIFETAVGVCFGVLVLGEPLTLRIVGGLGLVAASVALVTWRRRGPRSRTTGPRVRPRPPPAPATPP